ncbi:MFS transporter [Streptomyces sp. 4N509B]|uniref:MFS transporter n=1 Tax=Streptomyces sp. 4N509B TaxID=3457413 RepID=UPI003FD24E94
MRDGNGKWWPLVAVCLGNFMLLIDVTIVITAVPDITRDLGAGLSAQQWILDSYALALAALLMAFGALGDLHGRRRVYLLGLAGFAAASLACGLAPSTGVLLAARAVQGVAGAAMFASNAPLLASAYQGRDRAVAFGLWGAVSGAGSAVGVLLGGVLTQYLQWRAIFLVNLPISAVAIWLAWRTLSESRDPAGGRVEWPATIAFTCCAGALVHGLIRGGEVGWGDGLALASFAGAAAALLVFVLFQRGAERAGRGGLLDLRLLRRPSFAALMAGAAVLNAAAFSHSIYTMLWLQAGLGLSPVRAGLAVLPLAATAFVVAALGGRLRLLDRLPPRVPVAAGVLLIGVGVLTQTAVAAGSTWTVLLPGMTVTGVGVGLAMPVLVSAALAAAPPERAGMASGAVNTFRQLGFALGVAVLGTVFTAAGGADSRAGFAEGLDAVYAVAGVAALAASVLVAALVRERPPAETTRPGAPPARPAATEPPRQAAPAEPGS